MNTQDAAARPSTAATEAASLLSCANCPHPVFSHHLTRSGKRTYCCRWDSPVGECPCELYEQAAS